jgi:hypothetical protein
VSDDYGPVPSDFWKLACAHTERTTDDGSEERREICVRCGAALTAGEARAQDARPAARSSAPAVSVARAAA